MLIVEYQDSIEDENSPFHAKIVAVAIQLEAVVRMETDDEILGW